MSAASSESQPERIAAALRAARERLTEPRPAEPIAVVGIGCRFPGGVTGPDSLWDLVSSATDATGEQPGDRWDVRRYYDPDPEVPGTIYTTRGGFLDSVDTFDAEFFGISPREAHAMDPQQRLLLEIAWEALENAGIAPRRLRGTETGLFVGFSWRDYDRVSVANRPEAMSAYAGLGNTPSIAAGRVAYTLDLHGPVSVVDTACSSSLVAVHQAVQGLRNGDCTAALAGGVNLILSPLSTMFCCRIHALSADGRCKTFDASADGYGRAEGAGLVVLKRLSQAQRDGDRVYAVIRGSAVNHDGRTGGLTVPNTGAQQAVVRAALQVANVGPGQVNYIEAHGTGTALGDPIEVGALNAVFGADRPPLWVGSIKSNFGHAETAAGIAGLIKAALSVYHGTLPATLHVREPNPRVDWAAGSARVLTEATAWPEGLRIAGVSSFGFSGTNAHVVLEQPPVRAAGTGAAEPAGLLTLSARSAAALRDQARQFAAAVRGIDHTEIESACATANLGRDNFEYRLVVVAGTGPELAAGLDAHTEGARRRAVTTGHVPRGRPVRTALLIGHRGPGVEPLDPANCAGSPAFRAAVDECLAATTSQDSFRTALYAGLAPAQAHRVPGLADALSFVHRYAAIRQLQALGLRPAAVLGVGVGEYVAAAISGILEPAAALRASVSPTAQVDERVVARITDRGVLDAILAETGAQLRGSLGERSLLRAGAAGRAALLDRLRSVGIAATTHAELRDQVGASAPDLMPSGDPDVTVISAQTGVRLGRDAATAEYWSTRPLWPQALERALDTVRELDCTMLTEVGGPELGDLARTLVGADMPLLSTGVTRTELVRAVGGLFTAGAVDDLRDLHSSDYRRISLPTYPFQRRRFWIDAQTDVGGAAGVMNARTTAEESGAPAGRLGSVPGRGQAAGNSGARVPPAGNPEHRAAHTPTAYDLPESSDSTDAEQGAAWADNGQGAARSPEDVGDHATAAAPVVADRTEPRAAAGARTERLPPAMSEGELFLLRRRVSALVTAGIRQVFEMPDSDSLDLHTPLQELGFDSLMAIELRSVLGKALHVPVESAFAFEFPTATAQIEELTTRLASAPAIAPDQGVAPDASESHAGEDGGAPVGESPAPAKTPDPAPASVTAPERPVPDIPPTGPEPTATHTRLDGVDDADLIALARAEVAALEEVLR